MKMGWNLAHLTSMCMSQTPTRISQSQAAPATASEMDVCWNIAQLRNDREAPTKHLLISLGCLELALELQ